MSVILPALTTATKFVRTVMDLSRVPVMMVSPLNLTTRPAQMLTSVPPAAHLAMLVSVPTSLAHSNVCARLRHFILMANVKIDDYYRRKSRFTKKFVKAKVKRFRKGSVLADVDLTFADDATDVTPDALKSDLPTSGEMGNMSYNPSNAAVGDFNECDDKATHNCHIHATCINKPGSFECRCKEKYSGDGVKNCEYSLEPADDPDDNKNKKLGIIFGAFFGVVVLLLIVGLFFHLRYKRYEADLEDKNNTSFTTRSVNSGVTFPENSKEDSKRTGSYELQSRQMYASLSPQSRTSGDYDYPDPQPTGTRESFPYYDNPGLQRDHAQ